MFCTSCGAEITVGNEGTKIHVTGTNAEEVAQVARQLASDLSSHRQSRTLRTPWVSGTFYLVCVIAVIAVLLVAGRVLPAWALPIVVIGAVVIVTTVGAFQLRQDDRIGERNFVALMGATLRHLPQLAHRPTAPGEPDDGTETTSYRS